MQNKKWLIVSLSFFFAIILVITVVAQNIYYDKLPFVVMGYAKQGNLKEEIELVGKVEYEQENSNYFSQFSYNSIDLLVDNGAKISSGTPIFSVSLEEIDTHQKSLQLEIEEILQQNNDSYLNDDVKIKGRVKSEDITTDFLANSAFSEVKLLAENGDYVTTDQPIYYFIIFIYRNRNKNCRS